MTDLTPWTDQDMLPAVRTTAERWQDWISVFKDIYKAAEVLAQTPMVPREMLNNTPTVAAAMMKGYELGIDPLDALANIYVIHGRIGFYAEFMRRRIIQSGHTFRVVESTDNRCIVEGTRKEGGEPQRAQFTAEQARKASLQLGAYPADKLLARATSRLCRQVFPDVLSGTLIVEDMLDGLIPAGDDDQPPPAAATGPALTRKRRPKPATAAATQPPTKSTTDDVDDLLNDTSENGMQPADEPVASEPISPATAPVVDDDEAAAEDDLLNDEDRTPGPGQLGLAVIDEPDILEEDDGPLITPAQLTKLSILLREAGMDDREARHNYVTATIGRPIDTAKDLTKDEASRIIDILEQGPPPTDDD